MDYDIAVIGNDAAAVEMLRLAGSCHRRTLAILPSVRHSSWLVTQALRRLVSDLLVDQSPQRRHLLARTGTPRLLKSLLRNAIVAETNELTAILANSNVDTIVGEAQFVDGQHIAVQRGDVQEVRTVTTRYAVIGTGIRRSVMHGSADVTRFLSPELLLNQPALPNQVCLLGGGGQGAGLAALLSLFGVDTRLLTREDSTSVMLELASLSGVEIGEHPEDLGIAIDPDPASAYDSCVVDCRRRVGLTESLQLSAIGVEADERGQLWCSGGSLETWCRGVFGVGDVVGFAADSVLDPSDQAERVLFSMMRSDQRERRSHHRISDAGRMAASA